MSELSSQSLALAVSALALAGLLTLTVLYTFANTDLRGRGRSLRSRLEGLDVPAMITGADGRLRWMNRAMSLEFPGRHREVTGALGSAVEVDAGLIYRLLKQARRLGFALQPVRRVGGHESRLLSVVSDRPGRFAWTLLPDNPFPEHEAVTDVAAYEHAPFAHLRLHSDGRSEPNARFRESFVATADLVDSLLAGIDRSGRVRRIIPAPGGIGRMCEVVALPARSYGQAFRDYLVMPLDGAREAPGSAAAALEAVPVALIQFDLDGRPIWANLPAREMLGSQIGDAASLDNLFEPLGRPISALIRDALSDSRSRREMVRLRHDEHQTFAQITLTRVELAGHDSLLAVLSDASELRLLEDKFAQSQKMEAVGKLAGGVAHDFNNVLTAISGHSDLLLLGKDALHPDYSDLMQIRQNTHRAAALVRQLLAFSRQQTLKPTLLSVQDIASDSQYMLNRLIGEKVTLSVEHGRDLHPVRADRQQIEQALMNLVVNARDAMPEGGAVTIRTRNLDFSRETVIQRVGVPAGDYVEISVLDSGTGVPSHVIDRVFDPFFTTKPVGEGTGLGLSTVYGIVKQSGGYVFVENRAKGGAEFRILLPRAWPGEEDLPTLREPVRPSQADLTGQASVLLVEDEDPVRSFASRALRLRGYQVLEAASAEEASVLLNDPSNKVDLIVSDVVMPGMDGPTFVARAREIRPGLRVVFMSGYAEDSFRRNLVDHDFLFLPKPFSLTELTARVKEALGQEQPAEPAS